MHEILREISEQKTLTRQSAERAMTLILSGSASSEQIAGLLLGLRSRGETLDELVGFTSVMRAHAIPVSLPGGSALDIVGTGGDGLGTFNISTASSFVCAGAGATVAKHGNRSVSSKCGSSDVLAALGIHTTLGKKGVEYCLNEVGLAFIFAPLFHPALKHVMPVRKAMGVRTCFNILGPLCNPAHVQHLLIGAFSVEMAETMIQILATLGASRVVSVHSDDGMDELSISAPSTVFVYDGGTPSRHRVDPTELGLVLLPISEILGGDADENAAIIQSVLNGSSGGPRDVVVLNSAYALFAGEIVDSIAEGLEAARSSIDSGAAKRSLERLIDASTFAKGLN